MALGLALAACGGDGASAGASNGNSADSAPASGDQPPRSTDQPPVSGDRPPGSTEKPPADADDPAGPGGGRLGPLCQEFCAAIDHVVSECGMNDGDVAMDSLCSGEIACDQIPATPCDAQIADLLGCFIRELGGLCQAGSPGENGQPPSADELCQPETRAAQSCSEANGIDDGGNEGPGEMNPPPSCTPMGSCACDDECDRCTCQAGADATKIQACFMQGAACGL
ncbi:MAG: hypothetical protein EOO73_12820 [Myxococcales bacterium]|nr:MAG: hypothetical protein EOO73_12820 [Myxococcales bacterium]